MANKRINDLPVATSTTVGDKLAIDGDTTRSITVENFLADKRPNLGIENVDNTSDADKPISTATQTALDLKADTADLATVATSGDYADLSNKPTLGTAAAAATADFATAAQGATADSAVQPGDLSTVATSGSYGDLSDQPFTVPAGGATGQVLAKNSGTDGDTEWVDQTGGGGGGAWSNARLAKTAAYTLLNADKAKTIALGGSAFYTLTVSAASGYDAEFAVVVLNEDTGRGKTIACDGLSSFILWPGQSCTIFNQNNVWKVNPVHQPWMPESQPTFYVDPVNGLDTNDGLAAGAGGAFKTLAFGASNAYSNVYTRNVGSTVIDGSNNTFQEFVTAFYPLSGGGVLIFQNLTWKPINSGYCLQFGDGALVGLTDLTFSSAGVTTPLAFVTGHNHGVLDVNTGVEITPADPITDVFVCDYDTHFNINNGITINAGTILNFVYNGGQRSNWDINGAHTYVGAPTIGRFAWARMCTTMVFQGNVAFSGAVSASAALLNQNGVILNLSGATLTGGTPTPTTGGQYNTTIDA